MRTITAAGLVVLALAAGCGGDGEVLDSTGSVCDQFAAHARAGLPAGERAAVVDSMGEVIGNAAGGVVEAFDGLRDTAGGSDSAYQLAADTFAQACFDAGWDG